MIRFDVAMMAFALSAMPVLAQSDVTGAGSAAGAPAPAITSEPQPSGTNLPGVSDSTTTGSTAAGAGGAETEDRCELPGTAANANPTADMPTVNEAEPTCR